MFFWFLHLKASVNRKRMFRCCSIHASSGTEDHFCGVTDKFNRLYLLRQLLQMLLCSALKSVLP